LGIYELAMWNSGTRAVDAGEGRVLITGGYQAGAAMIKIEKKADAASALKNFIKC